jgi:carbonic anhydrase
MNLHAQPPVAGAVAAGQLTLRGRYYDNLTGRIERYDEGTKRFELLAG